MPDHFAVLSQPRRPWLDEAALKEAFHRATAQQHPDVSGGSGEQAAALNAAYAVLRDPAARLRHLLELEVPEALQTLPPISPDLAGYFGKVAELHQAAAAFEKKNVLSRALAHGGRIALREEIKLVFAALDDVESSDLRDLDARWAIRITKSDPLIHTAVAIAQQQLAIKAKWKAQLREDLFRLGD